MRFFILAALILLGGGVFWVMSRDVEAEAIVFGSEQCHYCKMGIVDREHAAQFVTKKGKQFKFDAIECMVNELRTHQEPLAIIRVSDYGESTMTDARTASYLVSPQIHSPMGADLSGFSSLGRAQEAQKAYGGSIYKWSELVTVVKKAR